MTDETIFAAALEQPDPAARTAYLASTCGDPAQRQRVEGLLAAHDKAGDFLGRPAVTPPEPGTVPTRAFGEAPDPASTHTFGPDARPDPDDEAIGFLRPSARPDALGRIGHYDVLEVLGRGGFGIVFRAFDDVLQRVVAVKVLAPQMAATSPARKRFLREARSAAAVRHENVVHIHAIEEHPLPYLVMEFVPGETLQQLLDRTGPLDTPEVLRIGRQVAEGLAAAHEQGLVHRDIKPANVLIEGGPQKRVKMTDFGLARAADDASISQSGVVAGTPMYMAPEQARGDSLDHRADLFSLGSVLYVMCTGRPPFRATTTLAVLKRVAEDHPRPIREVIPEVPEWLCRVVEKLHAKDPGERFQTAREVADVLADCEAQLTAHAGLKDFSRIPAARPTPQRRRLWRFAARLWLFAVLFWGAMIVGKPAFLYATNRGELELVPQEGLVELIVLRNDEGVRDENKLLPAATDWLDMRQGHTMKLPPGKYQLNAGTFPAGTRITHWEVTTSGPLGGGTVRVPGEGLHGWSAIVTVERGYRTTVRPVVGAAPPESPPDAGFVSLFNGRDLSGWKRAFGVPEAWAVRDGVLVGTGPLNCLSTERRDYHNFHLRAEVKVNAGGDGGIYCRGPIGFSDGVIEAQILGGPGENPTGTLLHKSAVLARPAKPPAVPPGEWFTYEVIAQGKHVETRVNGRLGAVTESAQQFGGPIGLESFSRDTVVHFRKVEIKELPRLEDPPPGVSAPPPAVAPFDAAKAKQLQEAWAEHLGVPVETTNSIGMKLRLMPPGEFQIGSPPEDIARSLQVLTKHGKTGWFFEFVESRSGPQRAVKLTKPYYLGSCEVTVADFRRFVRETGYRTLAEQTAGRPYWEKPGWKAAIDPQHPVTYLTWDDATAFCNWLTTREKRTYRLPTEAEWEFACRAGTTTRWNWGDDPAEFLRHAWFNRPLQGGPGKVGEKLPNAFGLYDMHGNAEEWCADWHHPLLGIAPTDPYTADRKDATGRVVRGGFAFDIPELGRSGRRSFLKPDDPLGIALGFRVALTGDLAAKAPPPAVAPAPLPRP